MPRPPGPPVRPGPVEVQGHQHTHGPGQNLGRVRVRSPQAGHHRHGPGVQPGPPGRLRRQQGVQLRLGHHEGPGPGAGHQGPHAGAGQHVVFHVPPVAQVRVRPPDAHPPHRPVRPAPGDHPAARDPQALGPPVRPQHRVQAPGLALPPAAAPAPLAPDPPQAEAPGRLRVQPPGRQPGLSLRTGRQPPFRRGHQGPGPLPPGRRRGRVLLRRPSVLTRPGLGRPWRAPAPPRPWGRALRPRHPGRGKGLGKVQALHVHEPLHHVPGRAAPAAVVAARHAVPLVGLPGPDPEAIRAPAQRAGRMPLPAVLGPGPPGLDAPLSQQIQQIHAHRRLHKPSRPSDDRHFLSILYSLLISLFG